MDRSAGDLARSTLDWPVRVEGSNAPVVAEALRTRSSALQISEVSLW
jgi:hypothetical protein